MCRTARVLILSILLSVPAQMNAAEKSENKVPDLSKEARLERAEKMERIAEVHKKMAECLRSDKPLSECHDEMAKDCPATKDGQCPLMDGMHGMGHRRGKGMMKKGAPAEKTNQ